MGAKYLPTNKDRKATVRFSKTHHVQSKFIKPSNPPAAKPPKKK